MKGVCKCVTLLPRPAMPVHVCENSILIFQWVVISGLETVIHTDNDDCAQCLSLLCDLSKQGKLFNGESLCHCPALSM